MWKLPSMQRVLQRELRSTSAEVVLKSPKLTVESGKKVAKTAKANPPRRSRGYRTRCGETFDRFEFFMRHLSASTSSLAR